MKSRFDIKSGSWINKPLKYCIDNDIVKIVTAPKTDFWQRSFYGFQNDNAPAFLFNTSMNFTFSCKVVFDYKALFDQAGIIIYFNSENWFKASIEYENIALARLGSVVTNLGYSDWATKDIEPVNSIWYRLSRRGPDFLLESSFDGDKYQQARVFHMHILGETDKDKARERFLSNSDEKSLNFGLYACSPSDSSFEAQFSNFDLVDSSWEAHI